MSLPVIVVRPEPGCGATLAAAHTAGLDAYSFPLFAVTALAWEAPDHADIDALLIASANAPRHGGPDLARYAGKPCYAVGEASAEAARAAGLDVYAIGEADLAALLASLDPAHRRLLRLCGRERTALIPPSGISITERVVYASEPLPMPGSLALLLTAHALPGAVVLLHSANAARHFAAECERLDIPRARLHLAAFSQDVARAAGAGWASSAAAPAPNDAALLALAAQLCQ